MRLVLASRNPHKLRELERMLGPRIAIEGLPEAVELPPETGTTFEENALIKARAAVRATGAAAIADDSGICAEALGGRPGVLSARYAGQDASDEDNLAKLEREVPVGSRLEYVCVMAHVDPDGAEHLFAGRCAGTMAAARHGTGGFGYDPVFLAAEDPGGRTMAELDAHEKDAISHRGRALRELIAWLAPT